MCVCVCVCVCVQGSQKLLHWTAQDVKNWLWTVNLDEYVGALDNTGLHGALMVQYICTLSIVYTHLTVGTWSQDNLCLIMD